MRVLICIYQDSEKSGGSVRVGEVLIRSLAGQQVDLHVVSAYGGAGRIAALVGGKFHFMRARNRRDLNGWLCYRRLLSRLKPDVVHYMDPVGWMVVAGFGLTRKRVMHQHWRPGIGVSASRLFRISMRLFATADRVVAISNGAGRELARIYGVSAGKIAVIHNAIDYGYLATKQKLPEPAKRLGMAIRVVEDKGVGEALHLLSMLPANFTLSVAGEGPALALLQAEAELKGLAGRVEWLGSVSDIAAFYSRIDYYLFMSWYEGFGLSVAEAMACGKPVVGLLGDGEIAEPEYPLVTPDNSMLVTRSSPGKFGAETDKATFERLRDVILLLDRDEAMRNRLVSNAAAWIKERFSAPRYGVQICELYKDLVSESAASRR